MGMNMHQNSLRVLVTVTLKVWIYVVHTGFKDVVNANSAWCGGLTWNIDLPLRGMIVTIIL